MALSSIFRIVIVAFLIGLLNPLKTDAQNPDSSDFTVLTKQKVKDWIQTRIATAKLQNKMKANAAAYDDVVQAFFAKRKTLLQSRCWSESDFEATEKRIAAATSAMDMADDMAENKANHEKEITEIKNNEFFSDEQKQEMIKALQSIRDQKRSQFIEPTKPDWPAVKPYRSTLEKLTDWVAGNIPDPPVVE
jgi:hypothetical protein